MQLLHVLEDGSSHVDWMIAQDPRGRDPLVTFRLEARLDRTPVGERLAAHRIQDHRPRYLSYEGPLAGNRGAVTRVASGRVTQTPLAPGSWRLDVRWSGEGACRQVLLLQRLGGDEWSIEVVETGRVE